MKALKGSRTHDNLKAKQAREPIVFRKRWIL